jgi:hypothetical protein
MAWATQSTPDELLREIGVELRDAPPEAAWIIYERLSRAEEDGELRMSLLMSFAAEECQGAGDFVWVHWDDRETARQSARDAS